jgi:hypothetical protein
MALTTAVEEFKGCELKTQVSLTEKTDTFFSKEVDEELN